MHTAQLNYFACGLKYLKQFAINKCDHIDNVNDIFDPSKILQL